MTDILTIGFAYLLGSFPSAYLFSIFSKRVDIRKAGSGNVGGINAYRVAGFLPGFITILCDTGKGALAIILASALSGELWVIFICGLLVVLGHNYSLFLKFKGGKGLATTLGVFIVLSPLSILYVILAALILAVILRDINTAFGSAALSIPLVLYLRYLQWDWALFGLALAAIIVIKHIPDYKAYKQGRRKLK